MRLLTKKETHPLFKFDEIEEETLTKYSYRALLFLRKAYRIVLRYQVMGRFVHVNVGICWFVNRKFRLWGLKDFKEGKINSVDVVSDMTSYLFPIKRDSGRNWWGAQRKARHKLLHILLSEIDLELERRGK